MDTSKICIFLRTCANQSKNYRGIGNLIRQEINKSPDDFLLGFEYAFNYILMQVTLSENKLKLGEFRPLAEFSDGRVYPPQLTSLSNSIYQNWEIVFLSTDHPALKSRLGDLLWTLKWGNTPYKFALSATDAYLEIADTCNCWDEHDKVICLIRGLNLAQELNDFERINIFIQHIHEKCLHSINESEPKPGITMMLLDSILSLKPSSQPNDLEQILVRCLEVYSGNAWVVEEILIKLASFVGDKEKRIGIYEKQIDLWLAQPHNNNGIIHVANLEHALELARDYGFSEKVDEIRRKIQEIPEESFDFKELSVTLKIENKKIDKYIQAYIHDSDWRISFSRFGTIGPPCGNYEENLKAIEKQAQEHPFRFLISNTIYDEKNIPLRHGNSIDENKQMALVQNEVMASELFANFAPEILNRICKSNGEPDFHPLIDYFSTPIIPQEIAENLAKSFIWFFKGEYDISAHLIIPRIEAIFRIIAQKLGLAIIRETAGLKAGGVITLAELLAGLKGRMDESWRRYFSTLLINPIGINLRNRVCHGLINKVDAGEAALLLQVACYLRHIEIKPE